MNRVLIVIPCLNEAAHLEKLVAQLLATTQHLNRKIVIADGESTDGTLTIARNLAATHPEVAYIHNTKRIQSAAVNLAVATFGDDFDYLIRIDAHSDYPENYCDALLFDAVQTQAQSVVVSMDTIGKSGFQKAVAAAQNSKLGNGGSAHRNTSKEGKWVEHGHHALMTIAAFRSVGGYDEAFSHNEDAELDYRLTKAGHKIWLTAQTGLTYYPRSTATALFRQYFKFGYGRARTIFKHCIKPQPRQMAPLVIAPALALFILSTIFGRILALPLIIWTAICLMYGLSLAKRAKDASLIPSGFAIMIMHMAWSLGFWNYIWDYYTKGRT